LDETDEDEIKRRKETWNQKKKWCRKWFEERNTEEEMYPVDKKTLKGRVECYKKGKWRKCAKRKQ
jgi:hypothetical protein